MSEGMNQRGPVVHASGAENVGTVAQAAGKMRNSGRSGMYLFVDVTVIGGAGTLTPKIFLKGPADANEKAIWTAAAAIAANGQFVYYFYPAGLETALAGIQERVSLSMPEEFEVRFTVAGNAVTFAAEVHWLA